MKLVCKCLNFHLHLNEGGEKYDEKKHHAQFGRAMSALGKVESAKKVEWLVGQLGVGGVKSSHKQLLACISMQFNWKLWRCCNCEMFLYVAHESKPGVLLVNAELKENWNVENISPIFDVVLESSVQNVLLEAPDDPKQLQVYNKLQDHVVQRMKKEEEEMQKRIDQFIESEKEKLKQLTTIAYRDKKIFWHQYMQAVRYSSNDPNKSTTIELDEETDALTESQNTLQMTDALIQQSVAAAASGQTPHSGSLSSSLALASPNTAASSASVSTNASTTSASLTKSPSIVSPAVKPEIEVKIEEKTSSDVAARAAARKRRKMKRKAKQKLSGVDSLFELDEVPTQSPKSNEEEEEDEEEDDDDESSDDSSFDNDEPIGRTNRRPVRSRAGAVSGRSPVMPDGIAMSLPVAVGRRHAHTVAALQGYNANFDKNTTSNADDDDDEFVGPNSPGFIQPHILAQTYAAQRGDIFDRPSFRDRVENISKRNRTFTK